MDELADRQLVTFDEQERKRMVARMQQIAARDIPFLHLYYLKGFLIYRKAAFSGWNATKRTNDLLNKQSLITGSAN